MRTFYAFLKVTLTFCLRLFFRDIWRRNTHFVKSGKPQLLVLNHPSAFMDPLLPSVLSSPIIHFLTKAGVFKNKFIGVILNDAHMTPIYRSVDGVNPREANKQVFKDAYARMKRGKTILIFAESLTDEEFVRRVKPLKKGAARIAIGAEEANGWQMGAEIQCLGLNYTDPMKFRSDVVLSYAEPIKIAQFKEQYEASEVRGIISLNQEITKRLHEQVIHIADLKLTSFFEYLMILAEYGMNHNDFQPRGRIKKRWKYSKMLADNFNKLDFNNDDNLQFKTDTEAYFEMLKKLDIEEPVMRQHKNGGVNTGVEWLTIIFGLPIFIIGILMNFGPWIITKFLVVKIMKRPVFWPSVKMVLGMLFFSIFYFFVLWALQAQVGIWWITLLAAPAGIYAGLFAYHYARAIRRIRKKTKFKRAMRVQKPKMDELFRMRETLLGRLQKLENA